MADQDFAGRWLGLTKDEHGEFVLTARSLVTAIGGGWGLIESAIPPMSFSLSFGAFKNVFLSATLAVVLSIAVMIGQIMRKRPVLNAIASLLGIGIAAWMAVAGGVSGASARDFYLKDFLVNGLWLLGLTVSLLARRPAFGYLAEALSLVSTKWLENTRERRQMAGFTAFWLTPFLIRLLAELPLWLTNNVYALGFVKTALGLPLWGLWMLLTWLMLRPRKGRGSANLDTNDL